MCGTSQLTHVVIPHSAAGGAHRRESGRDRRCHGRGGCFGGARSAESSREGGGRGAGCSTHSART
eukprot:3535053-Prymnesium_polylepis.1